MPSLTAQLALTDAEIRTLAARLLGTARNAYVEACAFGIIPPHGTLHDQIEAVAAIFMCWECGTWTPIAERDDLKYFCRHCCKSDHHRPIA